MRRVANDEQREDVRAGAISCHHKTRNRSVHYWRRRPRALELQDCHKVPVSLLQPSFVPGLEANRMNRRIVHIGNAGCRRV